MRPFMRPFIGEPWLRSAALFWTALLSFAAPGFTGPSYSAGLDGTKISGPFVHENLAIYLVHGRSAQGPVPMTLEEALQKGGARVSEVGSVNQLAVENFSDREVFIQSGDIVTGGKQDRVFVSSVVLPPKSGKLVLAVFCVEPGRWTARQGTQDGHFVAADAAMPSSHARTILYEASAAPPATGRPEVGGHAAPSLQSQMWATAASVQAKLSRELRSAAADPAYPTSLARSLDFGKLKEAQKAFVDALEPAALRDDDVLGYVLVIDGRVSKAEIYASNALFKAMWKKQLRAAASEAIQEGSTGKAAPPSVASIEKVLDLKDYGKPTEKSVTASVSEIMRETAQMVFVETRRSDGSWVLRNYLARAS